MGSAVKIRKTTEWDADDLPSWFQVAVERSGKSVLKFCKEAGISPQFYYSVIRGEASSIKAETLEKIEVVLGEKYPGWDGNSPQVNPIPPKSKRRRGGEAIATERDVQGIPNGTRVKVPRGWEAVITGYLGENRYSIRYDTGLPGDEDEYPLHLLTIE